MTQSSPAIYDQIYAQDIQYCLSDASNKEGENSELLSIADYEALCLQLEVHKKNLNDEIEKGKLPALNLANQEDDLPGIINIAQDFSARFSDIIILGTGGSSLGGRALYEMGHSKFNKSTHSARLHIVTNVDPFTFEDLANQMVVKNTGIIAISKSGKTLETVMQLFRLMDVFREKFSDELLSKHFLIITEPEDNPLLRIGQHFNIPILAHDPGVGGRYSVLSLVGILPAYLAGLNGKEVREGAREVLHKSLNGGCDIDNYPLSGAALAVGLMRQSVHSNVILAYSDRLGSLARWYRQLWAESLGKEGLGTTPIYGTGPVDQHSQLQLWLDGPRDKYFTVLGTEMDQSASSSEGALSQDLTHIAGLSELEGRTLNELIDASRIATTAVLIERKLPVRKLNLKNIDTHGMGALFMHFMLETIYSANLLNLNPFDQPAVESGKRYAYDYLRNKGR